MIVILLLALVYLVSRSDAATVKHSPRFLVAQALNRGLAGTPMARIPAWKQAWQYRWRVWLPDKWQRIGACETGYGKRPGDFTWDSGRYISAFGIYRPSWYAFGGPHWPTRDELSRNPGLHLPTPWQQYQVGLRIWRRYGFSGWGCRNA